MHLQFLNLGLNDLGKFALTASLLGQITSGFRTEDSRGTHSLKILETVEKGRPNRYAMSLLERPSLNFMSTNRRWFSHVSPPFSVIAVLLLRMLKSHKKACAFWRPVKKQSAESEIELNPNF